MLSYQYFLIESEKEMKMKKKETYIAKHPEMTIQIFSSNFLYLCVYYMYIHT